MKKRILALLVAVFILAAMMSACSGGGTDTPGQSGGTEQSQAPADNPNQPSDTGQPSDGGEAAAPANPYEAEGLDANGRFIETRKISVEIFDRNIDGGTRPEDNYWSNWIKESVLRDLNIEIEWVVVPRWGEDEQIVNLLATSTAPDVCVTYNFAAIQDFADRGGVLDLAPYFDGYKELLPDVWDLLGDINIHHVAMKLETGEYYWIEGIRITNARIATFAREDWLKQLNLNNPTTLTEFEAMLVAFKENADSLPGTSAAKIVPFSLMEDVGWRANNLMASFVPNNLSDKDAFIYGYDDRQFTFPGYKEGVRVLNKWYNMGLIKADFYLDKAGDSAEADNIKAGNVGAFIHNWDEPYRNGENSYQQALKNNVNADAAFIAIDPFVNDAGLHRKFLTNSYDRKVFFPRTNQEPLASALYVNWISRADVIKYLQIGDEGIVHTVTDEGVIQVKDMLGTEYNLNSPDNIDYTTTVNGLYLGDPELTGKAMGLKYAPVDPFYIGASYAAALNDGRILPNYNVGDLTTVSAQALTSKRDETLNKAIVAPVDQFDAVYDAGYNEYLKADGQTIIDERREGYEEYIGD